MAHAATAAIGHAGREAERPARQVLARRAVQRRHMLLQACAGYTVDAVLLLLGAARQMLDRLRAIIAVVDWTAISSGMAVTTSAEVTTVRDDDSPDTACRRRALSRQGSRPQSGAHAIDQSII